MPCPRCADVGWVCDNHPDKPWDKTAPNGCECGVGSPCPECNSFDHSNPPAPPRSYEIDSAVVPFGRPAFRIRVDRAAAPFCLARTLTTVFVLGRPAPP